MRLKSRTRLIWRIWNFCRKTVPFQETGGEAWSLCSIGQEYLEHKIKANTRWHFEQNLRFVEFHILRIQFGLRSNRISSKIIWFLFTPFSQPNRTKSYEYVQCTRGKFLAARSVMIHRLASYETTCFDVICFVRLTATPTTNEVPCVRMFRWCQAAVYIVPGKYVQVGRRSRRSKRKKRNDDADVEAEQQEVCSGRNPNIKSCFCVLDCRLSYSSGRVFLWNFHTVFALYFAGGK